MSLADLFGWNTSTTTTDELPEIFPLSMSQADFVRIDVLNIYSKILTDVLERTQGLTEDHVALMWDNCVMGNSRDGLVTMLAKAMAGKEDLILVYERAVGVVRYATGAEQAAIRADYEKQGESSKGLFVSFKSYVRSDMVKLYSAFEHCTIAALHKSMNLSKAIQLKMSELRSSVSLADSADAKSQAMSMAQALAKGNDILLDAKDMIETSVPDLTAVKETIMFLNQKRSFYLGMPESYINGEQTGGLGTTGENDTKAIERGLKNYYFAVIKPVAEALFGSTLSYKSQDFRQIAGSMEVIKTFALVDESLISVENKQKIINSLLDLPEDAKGDKAPAAQAPALPAPKDSGAGAIA